jgi:extracellular factor (EF) 3-hydroxypalmitic acid methyl ester biosynthesis protein
MHTQTVTSVSSMSPLIAGRLAVQTELDCARQRFREGQVELALDGIIQHMQNRRAQEPGAWPEYARACLDHPVRAVLHQDPFTFRAFSKPRGYAGDAVMMDYIYGLGEYEQAARNTTSLGRAIFECNRQSYGCQAVRHRRQLLARTIDECAARGGDRVLAVAAGHLREVELSSAVRSGQLRDFLAFDQDNASLAAVAQDYGHLGVRVMPGTVRHILARKLNPGQFDLIYAAGLFDYLPPPVAAALTCRMFEMTRPGGTLLIPNFLKSTREAGYMESFMDWHLIYRDHADLFALVAAVPGNWIADFRLFNDPYDTIGYLMLVKAR